LGGGAGGGVSAGVAVALAVAGGGGEGGAGRSGGGLSPPQAASTRVMAVSTAKRVVRIQGLLRNGILAETYITDSPRGRRHVSTGDLSIAEGAQLDSWQLPKRRK
jgi:hypothetical protein